MKVGRLLLRTTVGALFLGHGSHKLFGWFGGAGLDGTAKGFESMGLRPGKLHAALAGTAETAGGASLVLGYRTPLASAAVISVMLTAIKRVHLEKGPWARDGGYEFNVVLLAAAMALAESGPGALSLDALRGKRREGARYGLLALALGTAGAAAVHFAVEQQAARQGEPLTTQDGAGSVGSSDPGETAAAEAAAITTASGGHTWGASEPESSGAESGAGSDPEPLEDAEAES